MLVYRTDAGLQLTTGRNADAGIPAFTYDFLISYSKNNAISSSMDVQGVSLF